MSVDLPLMLGAVRRNSPSSSKLFATHALRSIQCGERESKCPAEDASSSSPSTVRPTFQPLALEEEACRAAVERIRFRCDAWSIVLRCPRSTMASLSPVRTCSTSALADSQAVTYAPRASCTRSVVYLVVIRFPFRSNGWKYLSCFCLRVSLSSLSRSAALSFLEVSIPRMTRACVGSLRPSMLLKMSCVTGFFLPWRPLSELSGPSPYGTPRKSSATASARLRAATRTWSDSFNTEGLTRPLHIASFLSKNAGGTMSPWSEIASAPSRPSSRTTTSSISRLASPSRSISSSGHETPIPVS